MDIAIQSFLNYSNFDFGYNNEFDLYEIIVCVDLRKSNDAVLFFERTSIEIEDQMQNIRFINQSLNTFDLVQVIPDNYAMPFSILPQDTELQEFANTIGGYTNNTDTQRLALVACTNGVNRVVKSLRIPYLCKGSLSIAISSSNEFFGNKARVVLNGVKR